MLYVRTFNKNFKSRSSGRLRRPRNTKSMRPPSVAIFYITYWGHVSLALPRIRYWTPLLHSVPFFEPLIQCSQCFTTNQLISRPCFLSPQWSLELLDKPVNKLVRATLSAFSFSPSRPFFKVVCRLHAWHKLLTSCSLTALFTKLPAP